MASFEQKYEVQKNRTITCLMGTAHEGEKGISMSSFSGPNDDKKQKMIDGFIEDGILKKVPLTDDERNAILKAQEIIKAREERRLEAKDKAEKEAAEKLEVAEKAKAKKEAAILEANFSSMNKAPMIEFAEKWKIALSGTTAEEIRTELISVQEALAATG